MRDTVYVVGHGKLALKILQELGANAQKHNFPLKSVETWDNFPHSKIDSSRAVIIHVGSGKQFCKVLECCQSHQIPLIQASTGMIYPEHLSRDMQFVLIEAPNMAIPVIKFNSLLERIGPLFRDCEVSITESHQEAKTSIPVTTLKMANTLTLDRHQIHSVRDKKLQQDKLGVPSEYLDQHSLHIIDIIADNCKISLKTEVLGLETCLLGILSVMNCMDKLSPGKYKLTDLVQAGMI